MDNARVVVITGAAGRIAYSLIPLICSGQIFGQSTPIHLRYIQYQLELLVLNLVFFNPFLHYRLYDIELMKDKLHGCEMEIADCAFPLVASVVATSDPSIAFADADVVVLLGGAPRYCGSYTIPSSLN